MKPLRDRAMPKLRPFLKWAGGKRWFVANCHSLLTTEFGNYIEPFLGSGAVFFHLSPRRGVLGDKNIELINTYRAIQKDWGAVWRRLRHHSRNHGHEYYYRIRDQKPKTRAAQAARFIYLNRTCFNGLYRVNRQGLFNVPKGSKDMVLFPDDNFRGISRLLGGMRLCAGDFADLIDTAQAGDLVFADPPYTVKHNNNNFLKYNEVIFSWADQVRLARVLREARNRGVQIVLCNADHASVRELYRGFERVFSVERYSVLAAGSCYRRRTTELVVTNILES